MSGADIPSASAAPKDGEASTTSEPATFFFVNESSEAPKYKSGNRSDIRAHVRKVTAKQFGLTHKVPRKRAERLSRYAPLAPHGFDPGNSRGSEHHRNCPISALSTSKVSPPSTCPLPAGTKLIDITESPRSKAISGPEFIEGSESFERQGSNTVYCHACGQPLNLQGQTPIKRSRLRENSLAPTKLRWARSDPVGIFGAGRIDPFSSLPMDEGSSYAQELLDHGEYNHNLNPLYISIFLLYRLKARSLKLSHIHCLASGLMNHPAAKPIPYLKHGSPPAYACHFYSTH
jgi:hypothetical protein